MLSFGKECHWWKDCTLGSWCYVAWLKVESANFIDVTAGDVSKNKPMKHMNITLLFKTIGKSGKPFGIDLMGIKSLPKGIPIFFFPQAYGF